MLPTVVTYTIGSTISSTSIASTQQATNTFFVLNGTYGTTVGGILPSFQQRITITSGGDDRGIYFHVVGLNGAGFTVSEFLVGGNAASTVQSNLDYSKIISIQPSLSSIVQSVASTASTVSAGTNGIGSSMWNIVNTHVSPSNIEYGCILQSGAATFSIQYTYDDPNNVNLATLPYPQPFNHPVVVNATTSVDGASNDPIFAWRLLISAGTGTVRAIGIQAGIGGP